MSILASIIQDDIYIANDSLLSKKKSSSPTYDSLRPKLNSSKGSALLIFHLVQGRNSTLAVDGIAAVWG